MNNATSRTTFGLYDRRPLSARVVQRSIHIKNLALGCIYISTVFVICTIYRCILFGNKKKEGVSFKSFFFLNPEPLVPCCLPAPCNPQLTCLDVSNFTEEDTAQQNSCTHYRPDCTLTAICGSLSFAARRTPHTQARRAYAPSVHREFPSTQVYCFHQFGAFRLAATPFGEGKSFIISSPYRNLHGQ